MALHFFRNPSRESASGGRSVAFRVALLETFLFILYGLACFVGEPLLQRCASDSGNSTVHALCRFDGPTVENLQRYSEYRWMFLLGLTRQEAEFGRRMMVSLFLGCLIGLERREANRGAGIRTMSLVSLGACMFCLGSVYAFKDGAENWDGSRVAAALPSGVGFLGGALIFKDSAVGQIRGLTTACGIWLSCAVGMCCGGGMYFVASFGVMAMISVLRFGPRAPQDKVDEVPESINEPLLQQASAGTQSEIEKVQSSTENNKRRTLSLNADE